MTNLKSTWASLESNRSDTYLLEPIDAFNLFIGLNPEGRRILALDVKNKDKVNLNHFPSWTGAPVEHKQIDNCYYMIITLIEESYSKIFDDLIYNLIIRFEEVMSVDYALDSFSAWLIEYNWFFKSNRAPLSKAAQRGLIGELIFLRDHVIPNKSKTSALHAWRGHDRKYHDFTFEHGNVEVKTTISKEPHKVTISNEKQLDDNGLENLFLSVFLLKEADSGKSLPEYVDEIRKLLKADNTSSNLFEIFLSHARYLEKDREFYEPYKIISEKMILYKITNSFPRIINFDYGVGDVRYSITLSACSDFIVDHSELKKL